MTHVDGAELKTNEWFVNNDDIRASVEVQLFITTTVRMWIRELLEAGWALQGDPDLFIDDMLDSHPGQTRLRAEIWGVPPKVVADTQSGKYEPSYIQTEAMRAISTVLNMVGCTNCGNLVFDTETHDRHHRKGFYSHG